MFETFADWLANTFGPEKLETSINKLSNWELIQLFSEYQLVKVGKSYGPVE
jgi:hypothetical protein